MDLGGHVVKCGKFCLASVAAVVGTLLFAGCADEQQSRVEYRQTLNELVLEDARTCSSGFDYPQRLIDGLSVQLIEELRCIDENWLEFYEPCQEPGCIYADGPQPLAARPEVLTALREAATFEGDFISIRAAYRDVGMQYYSRWYKENCSSSFPAAEPGASNHQGGRAIDVTYYNFWWDTLIDVGFEHPYENDRPHFELVGDAAFRAESAELQSLSITAFQRLWNRNHPDDVILEDGVYGPATRTRLGDSPVDGFLIGACAPGSGGDDEDATDDTDDVMDDTDEEVVDDVSDVADDADEEVFDDVGDVADDTDEEVVDAAEDDEGDTPDARVSGFDRFEHDEQKLSSQRGCQTSVARSPLSLAWPVLLCLVAFRVPRFYRNWFRK